MCIFSLPSATVRPISSSSQMFTSTLPLYSVVLMENPCRSTLGYLRHGTRSAGLADHEPHPLLLLKMGVGAPADRAQDAVLHVPLEELGKRVPVLPSYEDRPVAVERRCRGQLLCQVHQDPGRVAS